MSPRFFNVGESADRISDEAAHDITENGFEFDGSKLTIHFHNIKEIIRLALTRITNIDDTDERWIDDD